MRQPTRRFVEGNRIRQALRINMHECISSVTLRNLFPNLVFRSSFHSPAFSGGMKKVCGRPGAPC